MPALFIFLLKVNIALLLCCAGYYFVLRQLTFYTLNRIYLVSAILFSTVYPRIDLSAFVQKHQQLATPVQAVVFDWQRPVNSLVKPLALPDYWQWAEYLFWTGAVLLALRLLIQFYSLYKLSQRSKPARIFDHEVKLIEGDSGPFSFWKSIYVNPANHPPADLKAILQHEQIHVNDWHTLDIILAELSTIFYWFNPGVWLIKKAVRENIEFITDQKILNAGADSKAYQYSLVSVGFAASSNTIVNHFNISTIKKRIIMMNAKRSTKLKLARYAFLVPAVVALLLVFGISKAELVRNSNNAVLTLKAAIHKNIIVPVKKPASIALSYAAPSKIINTETVKVPAGKIVDTVSVGKAAIGTTEKADSLTYLINGVKAKKADFRAVDPDKISSVEILPGEMVKNAIDGIDVNHNVLIVTTNDSEAGKQFKEKIDALNHDSFALATKYEALTSSSPDVVYVTGTGRSAKSPAQVYVQGRAKTVTSVRINGVGSADKLSEARADTGKYRLTLKKGTVVTVTGTDKLKYTVDNNLTTVNFSAQPLKYSPDKAYVTSFYQPELDINHLSSKMIIIDGKEATGRDMKKLSAEDIESISIKTGEEMTKAYGDKAKEGVVFIVTKKAK